MIDLADAGLPADLVPGDPADVEALAGRLMMYATGATTAAARLRLLSLEGWVGLAGDAFRQALGEVPDRLEIGTDAFQRAASVLNDHAEVLRQAQLDARRALWMYDDAQVASSRWRIAVEQHQAPASATGAAGCRGGPAGAAGPPVVHQLLTLGTRGELMPIGLCRWLRTRSGSPGRTPPG